MLCFVFMPRRLCSAQSDCLVLLLCAGKFVLAVLEWMRSNATPSSRMTSGPLTTSERVSVCIVLNLMGFFLILTKQSQISHVLRFLFQQLLLCLISASPSYHPLPIPLWIWFFSAEAHGLFPSPKPLSRLIWYTCSPYAPHSYLLNIMLLNTEQTSRAHDAQNLQNNHLHMSFAAPEISNMDVSETFFTLSLYCMVFC